MHFKNLKGNSERENPKKIISVSSGLGLLQMVSELDIGQYASEEAEPRRRVDMKRCASKGAGPQRGWIVRSHVSWRGE